MDITKDHSTNPRIFTKANLSAFHFVVVIRIDAVNTGNIIDIVFICHYLSGHITLLQAIYFGGPKMDAKTIRTMPSLIDYLSKGHRAKYVFFWGHQKSKDGSVGKSCFSQWYHSPFNVGGHIYKTAEHFMMAEKARLFNDTESEKAILKSGNPGEAKSLGRNVLGFVNDTWDQQRFDIVVRANLEKFQQNEELKEFLLSTGKRVLVEASPVDKIWGIGMAEDNEHVENPFKWKGLNLLGFALMEVRSQLER